MSQRLFIAALLSAAVLAPALAWASPTPGAASPPAPLQTQLDRIEASWTSSSTISLLHLLHQP